MPVAMGTLSGSTNGRPIAVAATGSPGTTLHVATSTPNAFDRVFLLVSNPSASNLIIIVQLGGTSTSDVLEWTIGVNTTVDLFGSRGAVLTGGATLRAYCATANVLNVFGHVLKITP